jgi:hypothetical protein
MAISRNRDDDGTDGPVAPVFATTDCPECGGFVSLSGQGRWGETVRLDGFCPQGHNVYFVTTLQ